MSKAIKHTLCNDAPNEPMFSVLDILIHILLHDTESNLVQLPFESRVLLQVSWIRKRDLHILTTDIFTYTSDARYQVAHPEGSQNWTLLVKYAQVSSINIHYVTADISPLTCSDLHLSVCFFASVNSCRERYAYSK